MGIYNSWYPINWVTSASTSSTAGVTWFDAAPSAAAAPAKPKKATAVEWLRGRVDEITSVAFSEVPA